MDAWCALWFWPVDGPDGVPDPPPFARWLEALEGVLGVQPAEASLGQLNLFDPADLDALVEHDRQLQFEFHMRPIDDVLANHPWLHIVRDIADREGFWHWELEFAPVFATGGFDLQLGNPPWVRPTWQDDITLAELDPWFGVTDKPPVAHFADRRARILAATENQAAYLGDLVSWAGLSEHFGSVVSNPILAGVQTNLYMLFMATTWRQSSNNAVVGLLHPEGHFNDPSGGQFRAATYRRLRRHFHFRNELKLFEDIQHTREFGVHIYGAAREVGFIQIASMLTPDTVDGSLEHDGSGELPGIQYPWGGWDLRPHAARVLRVTADTLSGWSALFGEPGEPLDRPRLVRPTTSAELAALNVLASQRARLSDNKYNWSAGFHEKSAKDAGLIRWETTTPASLEDVILQGPHIGVATPFSKQPNPGCKNPLDYSGWDLTTLADSVIPRTNYQRVASRGLYEEALGTWDGRSAASFWRLGWRAMTDLGTERSLYAAILPPGTGHVGSIFSIALDHDKPTVVLAGLRASLCFDYLIKVSGLANIRNTSFGDCPFLTPVREHPPLSCEHFV